MTVARVASYNYNHKERNRTESKTLKKKGGQEVPEVNLWVEAGNSCLKAAIKILDVEQSSERPDPALTASACQLIHAAVEIDELNLDWQKS